MADSGISYAVAKLVNSMYADHDGDDCTDLDVIPETQEDSDIPGLVCVECKKVFSTKMGMKLHMRQHDKSYPFKCSMCDRGFHTKMRLQEHLARHLKAPFAVCNICSKGLSSQNSVRAHNALHAAPSHKCSDCGKLFHTLASLKKHAASHGEKSSQCEICRKNFHQDQLNRHYRETHGDKDKKCDLCDFSTTRSADLTRHMKTHDSVNVEMCPSCGKSFKYSTSFKRHAKICKGKSSTFENMTLLDTSHLI